MPVAVLLGDGGRGARRPAGRRTIFNPGPHGFSEVLYAFSLGRQQQRLGVRRPRGEHAVLQPRRSGSRCSSAGSSSRCRSSPWPGSLAGKKISAAGAGTLPTHTPMFVGWLVAVVIIVGGLTFFPALALGPIVEHLMLR